MVARQRVLLNLMPYMSWTRRLRNYAQLIQDLDFDLVACLFQPDLHYINGIREMEMHWNSDKLRNILESPDTLIFLNHSNSDASNGTIRHGARSNIRHYKSLLDLFSQANDAARRVADVPVIEVLEEDHRGFVMGMVRSLEEHASIRPIVASPFPDRGFEQIDTFGPSDTSQAVLVEDTGGAEMLHAAIYAHINRAKLIISNQPSAAEVINTIVAHEREETDRQKEARTIHRHPWRVEEIKSLSPEQQAGLEESREYLGDKFISIQTKRLDFNSGIEALHRFLGKGPRRTFISQLEHLAAKQIKSQVIAEVGSRDLTAFTVGFPYRLVHGWHSKAIGHVMGEWGLPVYRELTAFPEINEFSTQYRLTVVYDPGYFSETRETDEVIRALKNANCAVLLAARELASWMVINLIGSQPVPVPIDLIHLNTHGDWNATVFEGGVPFTSGEISRWFHYVSAPLIFNNSCRSWLSMAAAFMESGARGYLGTMWSIPSRTAAIAASDILGRILNEDLAAASSIATTDPDARERIYIFMGTVNTRLSERPVDQQTSHAKQGIPAFALALLLDYLAENINDITENLDDLDLGKTPGPHGVVHASYEATSRAYDELASVANLDEDAKSLLMVRSLMMKATRKILENMDLRVADRDKYIARGTQLIGELQKLAHQVFPNETCEEFCTRFCDEREWNEFIHVIRKGNTSTG